MKELTKRVVIDGIRYVSRRRATATETDISCVRCAFHAKNVNGARTLLCQSAEHHDLCDFCTDMLREGWHTWFERETQFL